MLFRSKQAKITNFYENRNIGYFESLDENNKKNFEIKRTEYESGKVPYALPEKDTRSIDLEPENIDPKYVGRLPFFLKYPFDSWEVDKEFNIGNYIKTDIPTDFEVYYKLCLDLLQYELDSDKSFLELRPRDRKSVV